MAKATADIRSLARGHTAKAIETLFRIMNQPKAPSAARIAAAKELMDRGWGKAAQPIVGDEENPIEIIRRVIVDSIQDSPEPLEDAVEPCKPDGVTTH